jgi:inner membrane protein
LIIFYFGGFISSYKGHSIGAIILSALFFPNPIFIAMALIGANLPDFDHDIKKISLYKMITIGLLLSIFLYALNLPFYIGIILCILPAIFYFSNHRGFSHSLLGIFILSILLSLVLVMGVAIISPILSPLGLFNQNFSQELIVMSSFNELIAISLVIMGLAILTLNKKIITPFLILFLYIVLFLPEGISIYYVPFYNNLYSYISIISPFISYNSYKILMFIYFPIFLGLLSHLILDSLSPSGIELFRPFSSRRFHLSYLKLLILAFFFAILYYFIYFL